MPSYSLRSLATSSLISLLEPGQMNDDVLGQADTVIVGEADHYIIGYLQRRAGLSSIELREGECIVLRRGEIYRVRLQVPVEPFLSDERRVSSLERKLGPDSKLAYEILARAQRTKATRPSLATYCGEGTDVVIDKLISLGYLTIRTELIGDRYSPIVKVTPKVLQRFASIKRFRRKLQSLMSFCDRAISTGLDPLDKLLVGGLPNALTQIFGPPGVGKSTLALRIAFQYIAQRNRSVLYLDTELGFASLLKYRYESMLKLAGRTIRAQEVELERLAIGKRSRRIKEAEIAHCT